MTGCYPVWTYDSGIYPKWLGEDTTPAFDPLIACTYFSMEDTTIAFSGTVIKTDFVGKNVDIVFTKTCL